MKVYGEYFEINGISYRRTTLLQFGNSWEIIGSTVLKNPGSAKVLTKIGGDLLNNILKYYPENQKDAYNWHEFYPDQTMRFVTKIFNGWYIRNREKKIEGVIQLFNLFCVMNQDINEAEKNFLGNNSNYATQSIKEILLLFRGKPVFLGWGEEYNYLTEEIKLNAKKIFDYVRDSQYNYLNEVFSKNKFYHPQYINMNYNKSKYIKECLTSFFYLANKRISH